MKWATRPRLHIDRTACAWLIVRFIDPDAEFVFLADPADVPADATAFDMPGVQFGHHNGNSSFEVLIQHHRIVRSGLERLAQIVHEADVEDERYDAPEAPGVNAVIRGLGEQITDDRKLIEATLPIYDALLAHLA
ncbi:MAG TPA: chromate resistance protein ChrB domain-containing protein [Candidatus Limnocylindria bacterium]|nr:chromate resistance protein ChrB domain-containing protein [Candidatus Limnocylindria bacterium]